MFTFLWLLLLVTPMVIKPKETVSKMKHSIKMFKNFRPIHFMWGFISILTVLIVSVFLFVLHPVLQWGWLFSLIKNNDTLNTTANTNNQYSDNTVSIIIMSIVLIVIPFIIMLVPSLAEDEEDSFRRPLIRRNIESIVLDKPKLSTWRILAVNLLFGLIHMIMGIPLAVAISLSIAGFIFYSRAKSTLNKEYEYLLDEMETKKSNGKIIDTKYFSDKMQEIEDNSMQNATMTHAAHNMFAFALLISVFISAILF